VWIEIFTCGFGSPPGFRADYCLLCLTWVNCYFVSELSGYVDLTLTGNAVLKFNIVLVTAENSVFCSQHIFMCFIWSTAFVV
jgi:hypothetical protein